jgi:SET domain-containing protein
MSTGGLKLTTGQGTHGRGVFAEEPIASGTLIIAFTGPFLRYAETNVDTYALQIAPDLYIGESGGLDDLINHSCEPNAGFHIEGTKAELFAIRDIAAREEILFDYSTTLDENDFTMACLCGTPSCRKVIGDGKLLPPDVWNRYMALGILPGYVQESRARG